MGLTLAGTLGLALLLPGFAIDIDLLDAVVALGSFSLVLLGLYVLAGTRAAPPFP